MTRKLRLYLDTSVFSAFYDERAPERQRLTRQFWDGLREYEVLCSYLVLEELGRVGDSTLREKLIELTQECQVLPVGERSRNWRERMWLLGLCHRATSPMLFI